MRIIWCVDVFDENPAQLKAVANLIEGISQKTKSPFHAAYVASWAEPRLTTAFDVDEHERFTRYPQRLLRDALCAAGVDLSPKRMHVVTEHSASMRKAVDRFAKESNALGVDTVVATTHGRKGLERILTGSFAETLMDRTQFDVVVLHTQQTPADIKTILVPTDLSARSRRAFRKIIPTAKKLGARLVLFHIAVPDVKRPEKTVAATERRLEHLADEARDRGIAVEAAVRTGFVRVPDAIALEAGKRKADMIAISAPSGWSLSGSVTRGVVRRSSIPVWVIR